jgi:hypothetical protein
MINGRIYQGKSFQAVEMAGLKILNLTLCKKRETNQPVLLFLKTRQPGWFQFFIDAGIGVLEHWDEFEKDEGDHFIYERLDSKYNFSESTIKRFICSYEGGKPKIYLFLTDHKSLVLSCKEEAVKDEQELIFYEGNKVFNLSLSPDLLDYIYQYESRFCNQNEIRASNHFRWKDYPEAYPTRQKMISTDENVLKLLDEGWAQFVYSTAARIYNEHKSELNLNLCPSCKGIARTPQAKQCRYCGHDWH